MLGKERLDYPENHIEADNRLSWLLGRLDKKYGDNAFYVFLKRNEIDTARSFTNRYSNGIIKAYRGSGILMNLPEESDPMSVALDYCDTVNSNIELFLKDKSKSITMNLENINEDFIEFWRLIGANGDIDAALAEFAINYNATQKTQEHKPRNFLFRVASKVKKLVIRSRNSLCK